MLADPTRLEKLVRGPFEAESITAQIQEGLRQTTMRMPPFMAQSTPSTPLTLTAWQYELVIAWAAAQAGRPQLAFLAHAVPASEEAQARRAAVLERLDAAEMIR